MATFPQGYHNEQTQKGEKKRNEIKMEDFHQIGKVMGFKRCVLCYFTSYICKQVGFIVTNSLPGVVVDGVAIFTFSTGIDWKQTHFLAVKQAYHPES